MIKRLPALELLGHVHDSSDGCSAKSLLYGPEISSSFAFWRRITRGLNLGVSRRQWTAYQLWLPWAQDEFFHQFETGWSHKKWVAIAKCATLQVTLTRDLFWEETLFSFVFLPLVHLAFSPKMLQSCHKNQSASAEKETLPHKVTGRVDCLVVNCSHNDGFPYLVFQNVRWHVNCTRRFSIEMKRKLRSCSFLLSGKHPETVRSAQNYVRFPSREGTCRRCNKQGTKPEKTRKQSGFFSETEVKRVKTFHGESKQKAEIGNFAFVRPTLARIPYSSDGYLKDNLRTGRGPCCRWRVRRRGEGIICHGNWRTAKRVLPVCNPRTP